MICKLPFGEKRNDSKEYSSNDLISSPRKRVRRRPVFCGLNLKGTQNHSFTSIAFPRPGVIRFEQPLTSIGVKEILKSMDYFGLD